MQQLIRLAVRGGRAVALLSLLCAALPGWAAERVALVIGNGNYQHTATLANPHNDARAVAAALERLGFEVGAPVLDASKAGLEAALRAFAPRAAQAKQWCSMPATGWRRGARTSSCRWTPG